MTQIEVKVVLAKEKKSDVKKRKVLLKELQSRFSQVLGADVEVVVHEVSQIEEGVRSDHVKVVISKVKKSK